VVVGPVPACSGLRTTAISPPKLAMRTPVPKSLAGATDGSTDRTDPPSEPAKARSKLDETTSSRPSWKSTPTG
jgi:hypothetical protein